MRKTYAFVLVSALALAGCANNPYASNGTTADTGGGALLGAVAGAVIGNQTGSPLWGRYRCGSRRSCRVCSGPQPAATGPATRTWVLRTARKQSSLPIGIHLCPG